MQMYLKATKIFKVLMNRITLFSTLILIYLLPLQSIFAEVKLPAIVSSNMVLQRNCTVKLWGWANANEKIFIAASWINDSIKIEANGEGFWQVDVKTTNSTSAQSINITSNESNIVLKNVLFGEVWLCAGQSNMEQPLKGYPGQPTYGSLISTAKANNSKLRFFNVSKYGSKTPLNNIKKFTPWQEATPNSVCDFSAIGYFFGQQLQEVLDVPVGIINTSYGGSQVEAWMSKEALNVFEEVNIDSLDINNKTKYIPTALFNAMVNPLTLYAIKGVLWYQGESNRREPEEYKELFPAMVKDWRAQWGIGEFPFYYVQIAPYLYGTDNSVFQKPGNTAFMREAQLQCLDRIPNSGIAITMDLGDEFSIHPPKKKEVADRLLFNALNKTYGYSTVNCASPVFDSLEVENKGIILSFKNAERGMYAFGELEGFEIAGADRKFYPAKATIVHRKNVFVTSKKVPKPVAVRYAWSNWALGTLYDSYLLPASSFRTDSWNEGAVRAKVRKQ